MTRAFTLGLVGSVGGLLLSFSHSVLAQEDLSASSSWLTSPLLAGTSGSRAADSDPTDELNLIYQRRIPAIVQAITVANEKPSDSWISSFHNGQFPGVDYTTGCAARRALWPAHIHWVRINALAAAYVNAYPPRHPFYNQRFVGNQAVKAVLDGAINWWFQNDFSEPECLDKGGLAGGPCPCGTPGLWNQNWFSNVILIPRLSSNACLLLNKEITPEQRQKCAAIAERGYSVLGRSINGLSRATGANTLDIASVGVSAALLKYLGGAGGTDTVVTDAYRWIHDDLVLHPEDRADGIRPDGSFGQHAGILYNGNYGKDYINLVLNVETQAAGTRWEANSTSRDAFITYIDGSKWMIFNNKITGMLYWDISAIGRFVTLPVADHQASSGINFNITQVQELGDLWKSEPLQQAAKSLGSRATSANAGNLLGNRMFYANDYMVHRGSNFVTTIKMVSTRTTNTECVNSQNLIGFHLGQGTVFNYCSGGEYQDVGASWDWHLLPGITTDYTGTALACGTTEKHGEEAFAGGASTGKIGVAAMKYTNPLTKKFKYRKAWFFFPGGVQHVTVSGIQSNSLGLGVYSVLDQKRKYGTISVNGKPTKDATAVTNYTNPSSLWHDGIGYTFSDSSKFAHLSVRTGARTGNWSLVGTSEQPPTTVNMFSAWITHKSSDLAQSIAYSIFPGTTTNEAFLGKALSRPIKTVRNDANVVTTVDGSSKLVMVVFWEANQTVDVPTDDIWVEDTKKAQRRALRFDRQNGGESSRHRRAKDEVLRIESDKPLTLILDFERWEATVADPSHTLQSATIKLTFLPKPTSPSLKKREWATLAIMFPQGADAGKSSTGKLGS